MDQPTKSPAKTSVETLTVDELRARLAIVPDWIQRVLDEARAKGGKVEYESLDTPFGRYPMAVRVADQEEVRS